MKKMPHSQTWFLMWLSPRISRTENPRHISSSLVFDSYISIDSLPALAYQNDGFLRDLNYIVPLYGYTLLAKIKTWEPT